MVTPGIYTKSTKDDMPEPFLLADNNSKGWHFTLNPDSRGDKAIPNGWWPNTHEKAEYDSCSIIMPYKLWVF